jgi:hypothetical protein
MRKRVRVRWLYSYKLYSHNISLTKFGKGRRMNRRAKILVMFFVVWVIVSITTGHTIYAEASDDTYIVVDDMEDYNDRDDIREVWTDGYADGSSGSNLNVSTAVGSPFNGATGPIYGGDQAMVLRYDNDGMTYTGLPGDEKPMYPVPYYSS